MKPTILLTFIVFVLSCSTQAQILCDSIAIAGTQNQLELSVNPAAFPTVVDYWETTAPDGTIIAQDSLTAVHTIYNYNPVTGLAADTLISCLYTANGVCCVTYLWNGSNWAMPGVVASSWECAPNTPAGCYDPGTGMGQYATLADCQSACATTTASWDCGAFGCFDPGTGLGQYSSFASCDSLCGTLTPSWDCSPNGCYDPGTGAGQYSSLGACQSACNTAVQPSPCDSIEVMGSYSQLSIQPMSGLGTFQIDHLLTVAPDMTILGEDSCFTSACFHTIYNNNPVSGSAYDTITTCLTYSDLNMLGSTYSCCFDLIWNGNQWMNSLNYTPTSIADAKGNQPKKLLRIIDVLGREVATVNDQPLFYIYSDGTVEKKILTKDQ